MAVTSVGNRVYVMGGAATHHDDMDRDIDRVEVYNGEADRWSVGPRMPRGLAYLAAFESSGSIITFPGSNPQVALQVYEPGVVRWRLVEIPPPTTRWRYTAALAGGRVYLFGGVPRGNAADALHTAEEYPVRRSTPRRCDSEERRPATARSRPSAGIRAYGPSIHWPSPRPLPLACAVLIRRTGLDCVYGHARPTIDRTICGWSKWTM